MPLQTLINKFCQNRNCIDLLRSQRYTVLFPYYWNHSLNYLCRRLVLPDLHPLTVHHHPNRTIRQHLSQFLLHVMWWVFQCQLTGRAIFDQLLKLRNTWLISWHFTWWPTDASAFVSNVTGGIFMGVKKISKRRWEKCDTHLLRSVHFLRNSYAFRNN